MKRLLLFTTLLCSSTLHAGTITDWPGPLPPFDAKVGWEDIDNREPPFDHDYDDLVVGIGGVLFNPTGAFHFAGYQPPFAGVSQFPDGYFFTSTTATGSRVIAQFISAQSDNHNSMYIVDATAASFIEIPWGSTNSVHILDTLPGDELQFFLYVPGHGTYSPFAELNPDNFAHAVVDIYPAPRTETPEPGTLAMMLAGVAAVVVGRRKRWPK